MKVQVKNTKSLKLDKTQQSMMLTIAIGTVVTAFCLFSSKALLGKAAYQNRVISARNASAKQMKDNIDNANKLVAHYKDVFEGTDPENIIGGKNDPSPDAIPPNGDNGRIVLDALPTQYDFPALLTSLQRLLSANNVGGPSINAEDQTSTVDSTPSPNPQPVGIDITIGGTADYTNTQNLIKDLERSIRPFDVTRLQLNGSSSNLISTINATTYFQPAKTLNITSKEVK